MSSEERKKEIERLANEIVNNMSLAEMMSIVVEKARQIAEKKVDGTFIPYSQPKSKSGSGFNPKKKVSLIDKIKEFFKRKKRHKGFFTKKR